MEIKRNDATLNRPDGGRIIDAPYVFMDIPTVIHQLKEEEAWKKNDRNAITLFKTEGTTIVISALKEGTETRDNMMDGFLSAYILEGRLVISTSDGNIEANSGQAIVFHPNVQHTIRAYTDSILLLTTHDTGKK